MRRGYPHSLFIEPLGQTLARLLHSHEPLRPSHPPHHCRPYRPLHIHAKIELLCPQLPSQRPNLRACLSRKSPLLPLLRRHSIPPVYQRHLRPAPQAHPPPELASSSLQTGSIAQCISTPGAALSAPPPPASSAPHPPSPQIRTISTRIAQSREQLHHNNLDPPISTLCLYLKPSTLSFVAPSTAPS